MPEQPAWRSTDLGRGELATRDMKVRIASLRAGGTDVVTVLWSRYVCAVTGEGFNYEFARVAHDAVVCGRSD